mmetsp:Transcript_24171/g.55607  ORF Transcript_24171/g.55607 Transcript_24171/m.55607 type:complete len:219 (+) Transcript_24171:205-861(+)
MCSAALRTRRRAAAFPLLRCPPSGLELTVAPNFFLASLGSALGAPHSATLHQVLLVVLFGRPEEAGSLDLGDDLPLVTARRTRVHAPLFGLRQLLICVAVNATSVLGPDIRTRSVDLGGVDAGLQQQHKGLKIDCLRVVEDLKCFGMTSRPRADFFVRGLARFSLSVADASRNHSRDALVRKLDAPKTAAGEGCNGVAVFGFCWHGPSESVLTSLESG